jgi:hypothetical protein
MANPISVPGTVVPSGAAVSPGGAQGVQGIQGPTSVSADAGNIATLGSDNLILVPQSQIWSATRRVFNAVGNPTFEVDQRHVGNPTSTAGFALDRWQVATNLATGVVNTQQLSAAGGGFSVPGTNFAISQSRLFISLATPQATLAAGEYYVIRQWIEGPRLRELIKDAHSMSLFIAASNAPVTIGLYLRTVVAPMYTVTKLLTIPTSGLTNIVTLPNLPVWPGAATWNLTPGLAGYELGICLAAGSTAIGPANDTWQSGSFLAGPGVSSWVASPVNTNLSIAFIQHEPGAVCTPPIDCPFGENLDGDMGCLRYFQKSYSYAVAPGTASSSGRRAFLVSAYPGLGTAIGQENFRKPLAKNPSPLNIYSDITGTVGNARNVNTGADVTATAPVGNETGISQFTIGTAATATGVLITFHYTAETGW